MYSEPHKLKFCSNLSKIILVEFIFLIYFRFQKSLSKQIVIRFGYVVLMSLHLTVLVQASPLMLFPQQLPNCLKRHSLNVIVRNLVLLPASKSKFNFRHIILWIFAQKWYRQNMSLKKYVLLDECRQNQGKKMFFEIIDTLAFRAAT